METIKKGSIGEAVKALQTLVGCYPDGIFGPLTEEALKAWQKAHGLDADGIAGPKTWAALGLIGTGAVSVKKSKRKINKIILHCTATPEGEDFSVAQVRQMHLARNFSDIGYHFLIYRDGSVHEGRNIDISGAHTSGHNYDSIGVCYVGGCPPRTDTKWMNKGKDTRTPAQKAAITKLVDELCKVHGLTRKNVYGHYEFAAKPCPCFDVKKEFRS